MSGIQYPPYAFFRNDRLTISPSDAKFWKGGFYKMASGTSIIAEGTINRKGEGDRNWDSSAYDMILVDETRKFIKKHLRERPDDPFFAYVGLGAVHRPHSPPDRYLDGSKIKNRYKTAHLDMLGEMDKVVGSLISIIERNNLEKDTIIIFASDNGGLGASEETGHATSGPLRGSKGDIWEGGHRIPLIIRYDGIFPANEERKKLVGLNDIYATICAILGIKIPPGSAQDSISFAKYLENEKVDRGLRKYLGSWEFSGPRVDLAIRKDNLKLVHFPLKNNNNFELYDLNKDISERNNLIDKPLVARNDLLLEMYEELVAIGPCPMENKDSTKCFSISEINEFHDCQWFKRKRKRCDKYIEGNMLCPSTCNKFYENCKKKKLHKDHLKKLKKKLKKYEKRNLKDNTSNLSCD